MRASEVALEIFFKITPFLVTDHNTFLAVDGGKPSRHGMIVAYDAIAV